MDTKILLEAEHNFRVFCGGNIKEQVFIENVTSDWKPEFDLP